MKRHLFVTASILQIFSLNAYALSSEFENYMLSSHNGSNSQTQEMNLFVNNHPLDSSQINARYRADLTDNDPTNDAIDGSECYTNCYEACHQDCYIESPYKRRKAIQIPQGPPDLAYGQYEADTTPWPELLQGVNCHTASDPGIVLPRPDQYREERIKFSILFGAFTDKDQETFTKQEIKNTLRLSQPIGARVWRNLATNAFRDAYDVGFCFIDAGTSRDTLAGIPKGLNNPAFNRKLAVFEDYIRNQHPLRGAKKVPTAANVYGLKLFNAAKHRFWACYPDEAPYGFFDSNQINSLQARDTVSIIRNNSSIKYRVPFYRNTRTAEELAYDLVNAIENEKEELNRVQQNSILRAFSNLTGRLSSLDSSCYADCYCDCHTNCHTDCYVEGCYENGCYANGCYKG